MKKNITLLTMFILITILPSCASLTEQVFKKVYFPILRIGTSVSLINYDVVYYSMDYFLSKHSWPNSKDDLLMHALSKNHKIDFEKYKYFTIEQCSEKRINIHFVITKVEADNEAIHDVKGILGIYIEDEKKVNIYKFEDQKIISSFTVAKYPYNDKNSSVIDGYSVHNYIEYYDPKVKLLSDTATSNVYNVPMFKIKEMNIKK